MAPRPRVVPLRPGRALSGDEPGLVEVFRCSRSEAVVVAGLLESHGIPTVQRSRLAHSVHPFTVGDQGEVVILVPGAESTHARRLLLRVARKSSSA